MTNFYNPGRGFALLTFSTSEEAEACIAGMHNTEVAGRTIKMKLCRPKDVEGGDHGWWDDVYVAGTKLFVHNVSDKTSPADLKREFGVHGIVSDVHNTGKGYAFITFCTKAEAHAAVAAMDGTEVCGRVIGCEITKPRGEGTRGREAGGVGGPGGGRGGRGGFRGGRGGGN